jgi:hypothetical protein
MDAIVRVGDSLVHYKVSPEGRGIYQATLVRYEGCPTEEPPKTFLLVKSFRHWIGSDVNIALLNEVGNVIDKVSTYPPSRPPQEDTDATSSG